MIAGGGPAADGAEIREPALHGLRGGPALPAEVLAAAELAPRAFDMASYFPAIRVMREKGHSWRDLADWLRQFEIEISYVHLRRLYIQESARMAKTGASAAPEVRTATGPGAADPDGDDEAKWTRL